VIKSLEWEETGARELRVVKSTSWVLRVGSARAGTKMRSARSRPS
jgi:hypothetical protein